MSNRNFQVWLISVLKGGVRKSTTAMMLAFALASRKLEILVIDADHGTQGVTDWTSRVYAGDGDMPFHVAQWSPNIGLLVPFIKEQQRLTGASIVLVDIGGEAPEVLRQAVLMADVVISPAGAEQAEIGRLAPTKAIVGPTNKPMKVFLTRVPKPGKGAAKEVRDHLTAGGFDVLRTETKQDRDTYAHVWGDIPEELGHYDDLAEELLELQGV